MLILKDMFHIYISVINEMKFVKLSYWPDYKYLKHVRDNVLSAFGILYILSGIFFLW